MIQAISGDVEFIQAIGNSKFTGFIHSIFERTVNIKCSHTGDIFTLSCSKLDNGPNSLVIDVSDFRNFNLKVNDRFFVEKGVLFIEDRLAIKIEQTKQWKGLLPPFPEDNKILKMNLTIMRDHIDQYGKCGGMKSNVQSMGIFEAEMSKMLNERSRLLVCEIVNKRILYALEYAVGLIGLGPGLTPSGDDFLTGFFTIFNMLNSPCYSLKVFCGQVVNQAKTRTNDISYMTLKKASIGKVRESIIHLIQSAISGNKQELISSLNNVLSIGSSSGTDIALGIVAGFEAALKIRDNEQPN
ncbi:DUF2877 domain-containing protein [Neobacillus sp. M.A.Huq-85]